LDAQVFKGAALKENTQAEVQSGSMFPKSKAAKQAATQDVMQNYFQYLGDQPMNKRMLGKLLKDEEAGALAKLFGDISGDEGQINRENQQISQGTPIQINTFDNNQAHIEGHTEWQKGPTYLQLGPVVAEVMEAHVREHREQLMAEMPPPEPQMAPGAPGSPGAASNGKPAPQSQGAKNG